MREGPRFLIELPHCLARVRGFWFYLATLLKRCLKSKLVLPERPLLTFPKLLSNAGPYQAPESAFKVFVLPIIRIQLVVLAEQDIHGQGPAQQYVQSDKCGTCTFQHLVYFNFGA